MGTGFTFLLTSAGAAVVFFFKNEIKGNIQKSFLGFAAGVMVAASVWSLLIPAISEAEAMGLIGWVPAAIGFVAGGVFLFALDHLLPHLHLEQKQPEGLSSNWKKGRERFGRLSGSIRQNAIMHCFPSLCSWISAAAAAGRSLP